MRMSTIRQMIKKGDPMLRVELPESIVTQLQEQASQNKRKVQDEVIKRLSISLGNEAAFASHSFDMSQTLANEVNVLKFSLVVPRELKDQLVKISKTSNLSLNDITALHLISTLKQPAAFGLNTASEKILKQSFSHKTAINECKRNHHNWLYLYEMEKLKLYMRFEKKLPRNLKEEFVVIDVKSAMKTIAEEPSNT